LLGPRHKLTDINSTLVSMLPKPVEGLTVP